MVWHPTDFHSGGKILMKNSHATVIVKRKTLEKWNMMPYTTGANILIHLQWQLIAITSEPSAIHQRPAFHCAYYFNLELLIRGSLLETESPGSFTSYILSQYICRRFVGLGWSAKTSLASVTAYGFWKEKRNEKKKSIYSILEYVERRCNDC